eukprot:1161486-Pelagomonas_calceolata.AAC.11
MGRKQNCNYWDTHMHIHTCTHAHTYPGPVAVVAAAAAAVMGKRMRRGHHEGASPPGGPTPRHPHQRHGAPALEK